MPASKTRSFQTSPRDLQGYLTVADLEYTTTSHELTSFTHWPQRPEEGVVGTNMKTGCAFYILLMFWSLLLPFYLIKALFQGLQRLFHRGDWLERVSLKGGQDLLYQCLGALSGSRFGDTRGSFWSSHVEEDAFGSAEGRVSWILKLKEGEHALHLEGHDAFTSSGVARTKLLVGLTRPERRALVLPTDWPEWLDWSRDEQGRLVLEFEQPIEERRRATRGRAKDDRPREVARLLGEVLRLNDAQGQGRERASARAVRLAPAGALEQASQAEPRGRHEAPLLGALEPHRAGWWESGWGLRGWLGAMGVSYLIGPALCAAPMLLSYVGITIATLTNGAMNPGNLFAGGFGVFGVMAASNCSGVILKPLSAPHWTTLITPSANLRGWLALNRFRSIPEEPALFVRWSTSEQAAENVRRAVALHR